MSNLCFCGSNVAFEQCCQPKILGISPAVTAQELMRSRYSAYVMVAPNYLWNTTYHAERAKHSLEDIQEWATENEWQGLTIIATKAGTQQDNTGEVEFKAYFKGADKILKVHHEKSFFVKENQQWFYVNGIINPSVEKALPINRNDFCSCGSGKKYKKCCGK
jgi:SEC-C motif-containing protein